MMILTNFVSMFGLAHDFMNSMGKMYVVVAVVALILVGIFGYMILIDRKITRLEKKIKGGNVR
ncbi:MAG TPA: CcmD family protein [Membranihabitans sp.]|nr:CcmD family protein [Membranihabitans sp.]